MGKSSKQETKQQQSNQWQQQQGSPDWVLPSRQGSIEEANRLYNERKNSQGPDLSDVTRGGIAGAGGMANQWGNPFGSEANLGDIAAGRNIGQNTEFQRGLQNQLGSVSNIINSQLAGAGRSGSGANSAILGRELGNVATNAYANQYNQDLQNQLRANQQIDASRGQRLQGLGDAYNNAIRAGGVQDKFNANKDLRGWDELNAWQNAIGQGQGNDMISSGSGTSSGTSESTQKQNPWQTAAGIAGGVGQIARRGATGGKK